MMININKLIKSLQIAGQLLDGRNCQLKMTIIAIIGFKLFRYRWTQESVYSKIGQDALRFICPLLMTYLPV